MNEQTCCFSGHRHLPKKDILHIHNLLVKHILKLIHIGVNTFICGGALGFDTLAALAVLKIRSIYPHIQLILALPISATNKRVERKRYCSISNHFKTSQPHCLHVPKTPQRMYAYA